MLSELIGKIARAGGDRRKFARFKKKYSVAYTLDGETWQPAIGIDLSKGGLMIVTQRDVGNNPFNLRLTLDTRIVNVRAHAAWHVQTKQGERLVELYGLKFDAIAADDWDALVLWTAGQSLEAVPTNKAQEELKAVRMQGDDVNRLLPAAFQNRLLQELVKRRRLAPLNPNSTPLVQFDYGGMTNLSGRPMHRLTIQSKVMDGKKEMRFTTRFMFDETGETVLVVN